MNGLDLRFSMPMGPTPDPGARLDPALPGVVPPPGGDAARQTRALLDRIQASKTTPPADDAVSGVPQTSPAAASPQPSIAAASPPWAIYQRQAQALAAAGRPRDAAAAAERGRDLEREALMRVLAMVDRDPALAEAMAARNGIAVPPALRDNARLRQAVVEAEQNGYRDPGEIARAASLRGQGMGWDAIAGRIPPGGGAPAPSPPRAPLPGDGSAENPFTARTQGQVDWFKSQAPRGTRLRVGDQLYTHG